MKTITQSALLGCFLCFACEAREVTLVINDSLYLGPTNAADEVTIEAHETAQVVSVYGSSHVVQLNVGAVTLSIIKNGVTNSVTWDSLNTSLLQDLQSRRVVGPAKVILQSSAPPSHPSMWFCTLKIEPESFPPGQTLILPEGTVGIVHVESSTNLVTWTDEWVNTFSATNANMFFRIRAERSLP